MIKVSNNLNNNFLKMDKINKISKAFFILLLFLIILLVFSFIDNGFSAFNISFKMIDILSDVRVKDSKKYAIKDSLARKVIETKKKNTITEVSIKDFSENNSNLKKFINSLQTIQSDNSSVRIAYYGDSIIEGDLITQDIRESLQLQFGGNGVGFIPFTSFVAQFRSTIKHTFSDNWKTFSLINRGSGQIPIGISGYTFLPEISDSLGNSVNNNSWAEFQSGSSHNKFNSISKIRLFYKSIKNAFEMDYELNKNTAQQETFQTTNNLSQFIIPINSKFQSIKMTFKTYDTLLLFGVSFEGDKGIILDNFAMRGNSGLPLRMLSGTILKEFSRFFNYKLIILQFGVNVAEPSITEFGWYKDGMIKVVNYFKEIFPESAILIISIPDRGNKSGLEYETAECVPYLVAAQEEIAKKTKVAYWNLFDAMGGYNSMTEWVNNNPPYAAKDYTHLSANGAKKVSQMLTKAILKFYQNNK